MLLQVFLCCFPLLIIAADPKCNSVATDPCVCTSFGSTTNCDGVSNGAHLKETFSKKSAATVDTITITHGSELTTLPADVFGPVKTQHVFVGKTGLNSVDDNAFQGSESILETVIFNENHFTHYNFKSLKNAKKLNGFRLTNDGLTDIPADAFPDFPFMTDIDLADNKISNIQKKAFHNLPNIKVIDLRNNKLTSISEDVFNLADSHNRVTINLNGNQITTIHKDAFKSLKVKNLELENNKLETLAQDTFEHVLDYLNTLGNEPGTLHVRGNPFKCDSSIAWLIKKQTSYKRRVANFKCQGSGKTLNQLTEGDMTG